MPVLFVGHGSPMNALQDSEWGRRFASLREEIPRPKAILAISAHWFIDGTYVTNDSFPSTIHDFSGFPPSLYEITYPAPGSPDLAQQICSLLEQQHAGLSTDWGLDHGTWSVLTSMFPHADIPVLQLSIDRRLSIAEHYKIGRSLNELRNDGVLIMGSGNIVHNLSDAIPRMRNGNSDTPDWARRFDQTVTEILSQHDTKALLSAVEQRPDGPLAHPTLDHWLPLIYAYAAAEGEQPINFPITGFDVGSISMTSVVFH